MSVLLICVVLFTVALLWSGRSSKQDERMDRIYAEHFPGVLPPRRRDTEETR